jgi:hypothetical protein
LSRRGRPGFAILGKSLLAKNPLAILQGSLREPVAVLASLRSAPIGCLTPRRDNAHPPEPQPGLLEVEVFYGAGVGLDEFFAGLDFVAHERGEHAFGIFACFIEGDLLETARAGFHGRLGELLGVHFA